MGEVTDDVMGVAVYYGVSILIISLSTTVLLVVSLALDGLGFLLSS